MTAGCFPLPTPTTAKTPAPAGKPAQRVLGRMAERAKPNFMNKTILTLGLASTLALALTVTRAAPAAEPSGADDKALGRQQVERLWAAFAMPDLDALDQFVAPGFQSLHEDGARDWTEERKLVAELKLTPYVLFDYKVTRSGDVLVVSYQCKVGETIEDARLAMASTPRLDVFQQTPAGWKLLSHVNVRKLKPSPGDKPMMIAGPVE
jgi:ketosteroid isomerase-like protein